MLTRQLLLRTAAPRASRKFALGATRSLAQSKEGDHAPEDYGKGGISVDQFISEMTSRPPEISTDVFDAGRAEQLFRTLPTRAGRTAGGSVAEVAGGNLPKAFHLAYFQPMNWLSELAADGTSTEYNAPAPYNRRMWAAGSFEWNPTAGLPIGKEVTQSVTVPSVEVKNGMMFVNQVREYRASDAPASEVAVLERRSHVFLPDESAKSKVKPKPAASHMPQNPEYTFKYTPSTPLLFRYSALTFNGHKIHYDIEWTLKNEGHPDLVVHGPMTATMLVEIADQAAGDTAAVLTRFDYRATSPMYVDREITLHGHWETRGTTLTLWAEQDGKVGMKGTATFAPA